MNGGLYTVEKILQRRNSSKSGKREYKIKWLGYPYSQCTWEPIQNLPYVRSMIDQFDRKQDKPSQNPPKSHKIHKVVPKIKIQAKPIKLQNKKSVTKKQEGKPQTDTKQQKSKEGSKTKVDKVESKEKNTTSNVPQTLINTTALEQNDENVSESSNQLLDSELQEEVEVIEVSEGDQGQLFFRLKFPQQLRWVSHATMKKEFANELITFYEKYMTISEQQDEY